MAQINNPLIDKWFPGRRWRPRGDSLCILLLALLSACRVESSAEYTPQYDSSPPFQTREYIFGVHPLHNPKRLHEIFGPLMEYLTDHIAEVSFRLEASRNYEAYNEKLFAREFQFSLPNPYQTVKALAHGYRVFGKMADDENFRGIILVRKDSAIHLVTDLKGLPVSFPAPTALAATMMPQYYLQTHGLNVMQDIDIRYVGSQESVIMNVFMGNVAAGATWPPPWRALSRERPDLQRELRIAWQTGPLPNNSLVVRDDVPDIIVNQVSDLLFNLHTHAQGQNILKRMELSRFEKAGNDTYAPVMEFLDRFTRTVRPLD